MSSTSCDNAVTPPHPRVLGWFGTTALAMGGSNQMIFLITALFWAATIRAAARAPAALIMWRRGKDAPSVKTGKAQKGAPTGPLIGKA